MRHSFRSAAVVSLLIAPFLLGAMTHQCGAQPQSASIVEAVRSGADVSLSGETVDSITAGRDVHLKDVTVRGMTTAGRTVRAENSVLSAPLTAGRDVSLVRCPEARDVTAGQTLLMEAVQADGSLRAGRSVVLRQSAVQGDVTAGDYIDANDSRITGVLRIGGTTPTRLENSEVGDIRVSVPFDRSDITTGGGVFIGSGVVVSSNATVQAGNGQTTIHISEGGLSSVNGYTVKGASGKTTVLTPDGAVYINGKRIGAEGPATYDQYRARTQKAPLVQGPGWPTPTGAGGDSQVKSHGKASGSGEKNAPEQRIELLSGTRVSGVIVFEGGNGVVVVYPGAKLAQSPEGARVIRVPIP
ncbi:MAG: hypothetical protein IPK79_02210 [Vampirovibrionales bacterium]|nr:hypothetical protein [Vampirovibrionales bacterium]